MAPTHHPVVAALGANRKRRRAAACITQSATSHCDSCRVRVPDTAPALNAGPSPGGARPTTLLVLSYPWRYGAGLPPLPRALDSPAAVVDRPSDPQPGLPPPITPHLPATVRGVTANARGAAERLTWLGQRGEAAGPSLPSEVGTTRRLAAASSENRSRYWACRCRRRCSVKGKQPIFGEADGGLRHGPRRNFVSEACTCRPSHEWTPAFTNAPEWLLTNV